MQLSKFTFEALKAFCVSVHRETLDTSDKSAKGEFLTGQAGLVGHCPLLQDHGFSTSKHPAANEQLRITNSLPP